MGLEAATYVSDLDSANPLAGDKKNQGDDHLRLLKSVLKTTLPNANRAYRFIETLSKSGNYNVLSTDDNKVILCDTTAAFTLTLPASGGLFAGWVVRVMKITTDVNPVFVAPAAGTINGLAKIRCNVPYAEYRFLWTGAAWVRLKGPGEEQAGSLIHFTGAAAPIGFAFPTGQSLLRVDYPELFEQLQTTHGAADGTHFSLPDLRDRFVVGSGSSYAITATGGEATHVLTTNELPAAPVGITNVAHNHTLGTFNLGGSATFNANITPGATPILVGPGAIALNAAFADVVSTNNLGGGAAHENRPPYLALPYIMRLC